MTPAAAEARALKIEHGALVRRLAHLQQRVGEQLQAAARHQATLEAQNLRLRAELVRLRTAAVWGLPTQVRALVARAAERRPAVAPAQGLREAQAVLCQTACVGHAHVWLGQDGQCRQTGMACDRLHDAAAAPVSLDAADNG